MVPLHLEVTFEMSLLFTQVIKVFGLVCLFLFTCSKVKKKSNPNKFLRTCQSVEETHLIIFEQDLVNHIGRKIILKTGFHICFFFFFTLKCNYLIMTY